MTNYTISSNLDITNLQLSDGAYRCYMLLQSLAYANKTKVFPSQKYLAHALGRCVRTIQRYLDELVGLGLIIKRRRGSISNLYTLVQKKIQQGVDRLKRAVKGKREPERRTLKDNTNSTVKQNNHKKKTYPKYKKKTEHFNDYTQRQYDFDKLEQALLGDSKSTEFSDLLKE
ncbi:helix-turn-helix domain-containing protein [Clostridium sp. KNHs214]|uniref:helix-turn-helix domain-containing protein n=1 Tax=Clostridium sp. KNHs214 TaxID=1540257 RepID=UPI000557D021|nr:helix-turn-helix domain-containing protein [Clostridium sp. KNHs214]